MSTVPSLNPREKLIEYVHQLPDAQLALAEQAITAVTNIDGQTGDRLLDYNHPHIVSRESVLGGEAVIRSTRTSVRAIVENWHLGFAPTDIAEVFPHLTLAQIFDALGYYSDHKAEINAHIERNRVPDSLVHPLVQ
ncbi:MAG: DUF433 domain-containing protein [Anaerolineae bacterium]|nr:DUF433 domain-containing protein [Anaerolineae bacterium]